MTNLAVKQPKTLRCSECDGWGERWAFDVVNGFEKNRRWETCDHCEGDGYLPEKKQDEDDDQ